MVGSWTHLTLAATVSLDIPSTGPTRRVLGALVDGAAQLSGALRFRFDDPNWLAHLVDSESSVAEDDGSKLSVEVSDEWNWLVYESALPVTLR